MLSHLQFDFHQVFKRIQENLFVLVFVCRFCVYFCTFGFTMNPYSHSVLFKLGNHQSQPMQDTISNNTSLFHQAVTLQTISINTMHQVGCRSKSKSVETNGTANGKKNNTNLHSNGTMQNGLSISSKLDPCPKEQCSMSPDAVRYEAEYLRTDFNLRMKQILFNSLINAYYVALVPLKFTQVTFCILYLELSKCFSSH